MCKSKLATCQICNCIPLIDWLTTIQARIAIRTCDHKSYLPHKGRCVLDIGVIYGVGGVQETFWTGVKRWRICCHLLSRGDLRKLNYNKTVFGPLGELTKLSQTLESDGEGIPPPHFLPLSSRDRRAPRSPSELVPHCLGQSYAAGVGLVLQL